MGYIGAHFKDLSSLIIEGGLPTSDSGATSDSWANLDNPQYLKIYSNLDNKLLWIFCVLTTIFW